MDGVLRAEDLVAAQGRGQLRGVERDRADPLPQLLRDEPARRLLVLRSARAPDRRQHRVHGRRVGQVVAPELRRVVAPRVDGLFAQVHRLLERADARVGEDRVELGKRVEC
ncbi:hypothetical protein GCM10023320_61030 [Pseudonocardia adelaidensis]|uniref:Uncharacterized protein n=1 Tax=Pseudonocardia adelaidensis TaxID=648754 RepID=A0ABP9NTL5_9PSEU